MLRDLRIQDFAIIDDLNLSFDRGLNIITGDSGAGKSILVGAVGLILGGRGSVDMIRTGADRARVTARFDLSRAPDQMAQIGGLGMEIEDGELVVQRTVSRAGKGKVTVNGDPATVGLLEKIFASLVDIHGQHEHHSLCNREHHITLLDAFGAMTDLVGRYRDKHGELLKVREELERIDREAQDRERRIDFLRYQIDEIDGVAPILGEEEELTQELSILANAEQIRRLGDEAYALLYDAEDALTDRLGQVLARLRELGSLDGRAEPMAAQGEEIKYVLEDLSRSLRDHISAIESDPARLGQVEDRLHQLQGLKKKYGPHIAAALQFRDEAAGELERLTGSEENRSRLAKRDETATAELVQLAAQLSEQRAKAALKMETKVEQELADLLMGGTRFVVQRTPEQPGPGRITTPEGQVLSRRGAEGIEFLVAPNAGETPKPLIRIASGGELSRIMLAIKTVLVGIDPVETLIFDEIDSGVGGGIAEILGRRLRSVAEGRQVICVTHLPQVASQGSTHIHIAKETARKRSRVVARPLTGGARVQEIARMLGGVKITRTTVKHAEEMLELSG